MAVGPSIRRELVERRAILVELLAVEVRARRVVIVNVGQHAEIALLPKIAQPGRARIQAEADIGAARVGEQRAGRGHLRRRHADRRPVRHVRAVVGGIRRDDDVHAVRAAAEEDRHQRRHVGLRQRRGTRGRVRQAPRATARGGHFLGECHALSGDGEGQAHSRELEEQAAVEEAIHGLSPTAR